MSQCPLWVESGHCCRYPKSMFLYNETNYTIEDAERGLFVTQVAGLGSGQPDYAGLIQSERWQFRFRANRINYEPPDDRVFLSVKAYPFVGEWDLPGSPIELAREAVMAREIGLFKTEPRRIVMQT